MKRITVFAFIGGLFAATSAYAATAYWTGQQEPAQTITGLSVWNCAYNYNGQTIWRLFETSCPQSIEIQ